MTYTAADGTQFTDADVARWAGEAEAGFIGATFGPPSPGAPYSAGYDHGLLTIRLNAADSVKLAGRANLLGESPSKLVGDLIAAM